MGKWKSTLTNLKTNETREVSGNSKEDVVEKEREIIDSYTSTGLGQATGDASKWTVSRREEVSENPPSEYE